MIRLALALFFLLSSMAVAQQYPALFDVSGVAADDVLNVRQKPSASAILVGALQPDARGVEVVMADPSGKWGWVNLGETGGWASLRYLSKTQSQGAVKCSGTEPFWSLTLKPDSSATFQAMGESPVIFDRTRYLDVDGRTDRGLVILDPSQMAILRQAVCSDGMSDRRYGYEIDLITHSGGSPNGLTGCCSLVGN